MTEYRPLRQSDLTRALFAGFIRRQRVTKCWRREDGVWRIKDDPFTDDWTERDYAELAAGLRETARRGGFVCGAFCSGVLKGFVSVEAELFGARARYADLSSLHVSADMRGRGAGTALFTLAKRWAAARGAEKLYISAHSAAETQAFYRSRGCTDAAELSMAHVEREPYDCQLECVLQQSPDPARAGAGAKVKG